MKYMPTDVAGVTIIDIEPDRDDRGFFSNLFCADEFADYGMLFNVAQTSVAYNYARGTLRGIHRQVAPNAVAKLVRCTRGAIVGVAVDVRPESATYGKHVMVQMSADNRRALFLAAVCCAWLSNSRRQHRGSLSSQRASMKPPKSRDSAGMNRNSGSSGH